jgi:hypothetical protein
MSYGNIFWGNSTDSKKYFTSKKEIIRIMAGTKRIVSCGEFFKKFNIIPLACKFLPSLLSFVVDNIETFQINSDIHNTSTRYRKTFMCQTLTSVNIKKEFTFLELSYSIIFPLLSKV